MHWKNNLKRTANQIKYELIKVVNFTIIFLRDFWKKVTLKCTQHKMKENLLLLKYLLELWKTSFLSTWQLLQRMFILMCYAILLINTITQFIEALKWNQSTLHLTLMPNTVKILIKKNPNLKLVITSEYQNKKTFLLKDTLKIGQKKLLLLVKKKTQFHRLMVLVI